MKKINGLYINEGFLLPDQTKLSKDYAISHEQIAFKFVHENYLTSFNNDFITDPAEFMLMRLHALQVNSCGKSAIIHCDDSINKYISEAISYYLDNGAREYIIANPARSYFEYLRYSMFKDSNSDLFYESHSYQKYKD